MTILREVSQVGMLLDQVLEGGFLNCVMVITPSRAYMTAQSHGYFNGAGGRSAYLGMWGRPMELNK